MTINMFRGVHEELGRRGTCVIDYATLGTLRVGTDYASAHWWELPAETPTTSDVDLSIRLKGVPSDAAVETTLSIRGWFYKSPQEVSHTPETQIDITGGRPFDTTVKIESDAVSYPTEVTLDARAEDAVSIDSAVAVLAFDGLW